MNNNQQLTMDEQLTIDNVQLTVSVSEVNSKIARLIKSDKSLGDVYVKGEISNLNDKGHVWFTLKDENTSIKAVMFSQNKKSLNFAPENGMTVTVRAEVRVYERDGLYQLYVHEMTPDGMGALYLAFLQLREKLEKEGLFSQKREIPRSPKRIAVITAETGAALQDILNIIGRRNPLVTVITIPAWVQGVHAPASLIDGINKAQNTGAEVIIFGRGGGSIEDLQAFNDEQLARAVFASRIPTISAVGHEIDFTIADFAADLRAPTPSAAAELCVPDIGEVYEALGALKSDLLFRLKRLIGINSERVTSLQREINAKSPTARLSAYERQFDIHKAQLKAIMGNVIGNKRQMLITEMKRVDALSPMNVLMRGYSIVTDDNGKPVTDVDNVSVGDKANIKLHKGRIIARIEEKHG
ncbi:MAG: exodeoxyribonuclease VII large subunit [Oscillospiraceae bacterium]|nr:exodeoxyribonuclease VII large subunit [Oscillospiraceae bacterium]